MFADLGHFSVLSIQVPLSFFLTLDFLQNNTIFIASYLFLIPRLHLLPWCFPAFSWPIWVKHLT